MARFPSGSPLSTSRRRFPFPPLLIIFPAVLLLLSTYYLLKISSSVHHVPLSPETTPSVNRARLRRVHLQERLKPEFAVTASGEVNGPPILRRTEDFVLRAGEGERWNPQRLKTVRSLAWRLSENGVERGRKTKELADLTNSLILVDGLFPPRPLHVNPNDTILITVYNDMTESTGLHFFGPLQTPSWLDGAVGVTGCPIPPGGNMTYNLTVLDDGRTGTFWWQAMVGAQRVRGGVGAVVVHAAGEKEDADWEDEAVLMVGDAFDSASIRGFLDADESPDAGEEPMPKGVWINGRGMNGGTEEAVKGLSAQVDGLGLDQQKRQRIRVVNVASGAGGSEVEIVVKGGSLHVLPESSTATSKITLPVGGSTDFILLPSDNALNLTASLILPSSPSSMLITASISLHNSTSPSIPSNSTSPSSLLLVPRSPNPSGPPEPHHFLTLTTSLTFGLNSTHFHPSHTGSILTTILEGRLPLPDLSIVHYTSPGASFATRGESLIAAFPNNAAIEILIQNSEPVAKSWSLFGHGIWVEDPAAAEVGGWSYDDVVRVPAKGERRVRVKLRRGVHTLRAMDEYAWKKGLGMVLVVGMEEYEVLAEGEEVDSLNKVMKGCEWGQFGKQKWS